MDRPGRGEGDHINAPGIPLVTNPTSSPCPICGPVCYGEDPPATVDSLPGTAVDYSRDGQVETRMDVIGNKLVYRTLRDVDIGNGWFLQYRGTGWVSQLIQRGTGSIHSHSAMVAINGGGRPDVLEVREFIGGRRQPLYGQILMYPGQIDVFRPSKRFSEYKPGVAVSAMRDLTSSTYGYRTALRIALRKVPLLWRFYRVDNEDVRIDCNHEGIRPHCSMAVAMAVAAGGVDIVPWLPHYLVEPGHITNSLFVKYVCTLIP